MAEHLEAVTSGQIKRLLINVPPGSMKSMMVSVFWPAWEWGPMGLASMRYISSSYSEQYAMRDSRRMRDLVLSEWYRVRWGGDVVLSRVGERSFSNTRQGSRTGLPFQSLTGGRADRVILDDPHSVSSAESENEREAEVRIFRESVPTRLNDPQKSAIVVVMQRLHERDVSGEILAEGLGYEHLCLPMEFDPLRVCRTGIGFEDPRREEGELLFPERFPAEVVDRDKRAMGSFASAAQFQQDPKPRGGGLLRVDRIRVVKDWPRDAVLVRCWDLASTEKVAGNNPDWTAGVLLAWKDGSGWIVDVQRLRGRPLKVEETVRAVAMRDGVEVPVVIKQEPGSAGVLTIDHYTRRVLEGFVVEARRETGSKATRAAPLAAAIEAGNVAMLEAPWNDALLDELRGFPGKGHDDQADALADAWNWHAEKARGGRIWILDEE
jgi:predicted phage terminase large subunit-like protein